MKHPYHIVSLSPDGKTMYAAAARQVDRICLETGECKSTVVEESATRTTTKTGDKPAAAKRTKYLPTSVSHVRSLQLSKGGKYLLATTDETKSLVLLDPTTLEVIKKVQYPKRPSAVATDKEDLNIVLGDKFGDVYGESVEDLLKVEGELKDEPVLGHVSMLTALELGYDSKDRPYVISADRDEHIRISRFPASHVIEQFCFGHQQFVSSLLINDLDASILFSAGGDDEIFVWDWLNGKQLQKLSLREHVESYLNEAHIYVDKKGVATTHKEITVSSLQQIKDTPYLLVNVESTNAIIVLKIVDNKLEVASVFVTEAHVISFSVAGNLLVTSEVGSEGVKAYTITDGVVTKSDKEIPFGSCEYEDDSELISLFSTKSLRKRGEF
ncbi:YALIA101S05e05248g1_1 [Yarrowia lipolytica]|nr:tRNA (guanine-N(7)-)-methyltransferase non-catalytic subunit TRM82 [Yarrowia lipolytica]SEI34561.1 YALIA101S05e05248g1_1 [Yarrowia lipolytica]VBB79109.1 Subunit of a tRNA methyltransferase complex composed of Trm8p and Trm82p, putative [Yarrowia lipolytica]